MSDRIIKVIEVTWTPGMNNPSLQDVMTGRIDDLLKQGLHCVGVERVTEFHWLMLFAQTTTWGQL